MALRKALKRLGMVTGTLALGAGGFALYVEASGIPHYPVEPVDVVIERTPQRVAHGRELAGTLYPERSAGFYEGGNTLLDASGREIYSANLTPDPATGIGSWTEDDFARALRGGLRPDGTLLRAIYAYLKTLSPVARPRPASPAQTARAASEGQRTYVERRCTSCHGERGSGLYDLRRAAAKYPTDAEHIAFIKNPAARRPGIAMPAWEGVIREEEYPALAAYVRSLQLPEAAQ
jgi:mono/diheme cytochrome c family protein